MPPAADWIELFEPLMNAMGAGPMAPADARCAGCSIVDRRQNRFPVRWPAGGNNSASPLASLPPHLLTILADGAYWPGQMSGDEWLTLFCKDPPAGGSQYCLSLSSSQDLRRMPRVWVSHVARARSFSTGSPGRAGISPQNLRGQHGCAVVLPIPGSRNETCMIPFWETVGIKI